MRKIFDKKFNIGNNEIGIKIFDCNDGECAACKGCSDENCNLDEAVKACGLTKRYPEAVIRKAKESLNVTKKYEKRVGCALIRFAEKNDIKGCELYVIMKNLLREMERADPLLAEATGVMSNLAKEAIAAFESDDNADIKREIKRTLKEIARLVDED